MTRASETYIPPEILSVFKGLQQEHGWTDAGKYNEYIRKNMPTVPRSTMTRWTRSFVSGESHSVTPEWHTRYRSNETFVPSRFSALRNGRLTAERDKWKNAGGIRYANISDFHRPFTDGALLTLGMDVIKDFEPNIFPAFSDWLDMDRFNQHAPKPSTAVTTFEDSETGDRRKNRLTELKELSLETIEMVQEAVPKDCTFINVWGNHENWLLRYLLNIQQSYNGGDDFVDYFISDYFGLLDKKNILWVEGERNFWLPITRQFWIAHGHKSRSGSGKTGSAYLTANRFCASVAVGHTHRQEVVTVPVPYDGYRFAAVAGTMGQLQPNYASREFLGHNWGFQLIEHPLEGSKGAHVEDVRIIHQDGYYVCKAYGKEYSQKAEIQYDEYIDFAI